jgi:uncharacterized membrane protein
MKNKNSNDGATELTQPGSQQADALYIEGVFSGPLPPPEFLREYEAICPGITNIMMENMEQEAKHRRHMDDTIFNDGARYAKAGQRMAFAIAVLVICIGFGIAVISFFAASGAGQAVGVVTGSALSGATLVTLVNKFIDGPKSKRPKNMEDI